MEMVNVMNNAKYFYRNVVFSSKNKQVSLVDINHPDKVTLLEEWLGIVVALADGQHTIQQMIDFMSKQYQEAPVNLEKTLHSVIERLEEGKLVQLSESAVSLPYYLTLPIEELDIEKAKKLIIEDGYNSSSGRLS
ncbi:MAG: hypothetical protein KUG76_01660 [Gammaproteobacteria bacterium]|nr:hypothetical protein [Gammaproteobacteria bacterium]